MSGSRMYRGMSAQERMAERRERVLTAAFHRFGTKGYPATTIDLLCADARVSTRAFYQCFAGRDAVLGTLFDQIADEAIRTVKAALVTAGESPTDHVHAGLCAYMDYMIADERRARIAHVEVRLAGESLLPARRRVQNRFAALIAGLTCHIPEEVNERDLATGLMGAVHELIINSMQQDPRPQEELLRTAEYIFVAALPC